MISFLSSVFIKDYKNMQDANVRQKYGILCGAVGIFLNILLFAAKFFAGIISASVAITADAVNNLSDVGSSLITLIGFKLAGQAPDPDHPFGHGRIEYISGLVVSFLIILMGIELLKSSLGKILNPAPIDSSPVVILILIGSICVKVYMYFYNHSIGEKIDSAAMKATAMDSLSDSASTIAVLAATLIGKFFGLLIDGWCGILVAVFILWSGFNAAKDTISPLLGQPPEKEFVEKIHEIVMAHPDVRGIHDLIVHNYGPGRIMISLHAEVPAHGDIMQLHDTIDNIELELKRTLKCDAVIHMDPIVTDDPVVQEVKVKILEELRQVDKELTLHDFRMVAGPTHTNIIFDILVPYHCAKSDKEIAQHIKRFVEQMEDQKYYAIIQVDHPYVADDIE